MHHDKFYSYSQAIGKWQEMLKLWQKVDDKGWEAIILNNIGLVYSNLREKQEALKYLNLEIQKNSP